MKSIFFTLILVIGLFAEDNCNVPSVERGVGLYEKSFYTHGISLDGLKTKLEEAPTNMFVYDLDSAYEDEKFVDQEVGDLLITTYRVFLDDVSKFGELAA